MKRIIGISFIVLSALLFSCQNDNLDTTVDTLVDNSSVEKSAQITLTESKLEAVAAEPEYEVEFYANAEATISRWMKMGKVWRWTNKLRYHTNHCPDVTIIQGDDEGYPKTITLNYGDSTLLRNEKVLSGIIVIEISAPKENSNYTRLVTYSNFSVDTVQIAGTSLITVDKENEAFRIYESDFTFTINEESVVDRSSNRTWTWIEGMETTEDQSDDVLKIEGIVTATNSDNESYKKEITLPLIRQKDCRFIVEGTVVITINEAVISTLDYGNGECDAVAIMTPTEGDVVEVDLAKHKTKEKKNK